jgi:EF-hand domain
LSENDFNLRDCIDLFMRLDKNKDGVLDIQEFKAIFEFDKIFDGNKQNFSAWGKRTEKSNNINAITSTSKLDKCLSQEDWDWKLNRLKTVPN